MKIKRGERLFLSALQVINGDRQDQYGAPEDNFANIAVRWTQYLKGRGIMMPAAPNLNAKDVVMMMVDFKVARQCGSPKRDNLIDLTGYAGILDDLEDGA
ncbi:MAG: DUF6378 domain-containing protein [Desulfobulbales bacterium]|nr:DUF6378 domain-containing protein [Desulfobulbales bacterium]